MIQIYSFQLFFTGKDVFNKTEKGNKEVEMLLKG